MMAYLEITLKVEEHSRARAAAVYGRFKEPFLTNVSGAKSKAAGAGRGRADA
ncbi:hypothetical protein ACYCVF_31650 [Bradyrhizobium sp. 1.29L]